MYSRRFLNVIDGALVDGVPRQVVNPANERTFAEYACATADDLDRAVTSARIAQASWGRTTMGQRACMLAAMADRVAAHADALAGLLTLEQGKPLPEARVEVAYSEHMLRRYTHAPFVCDAPKTEGYERTVHPLGVVAGIIPWNFPLLIAVMKVAPALLAGNAIIIKPAPTTPLTTLEFGRLVMEILPPGILQVLGDDGSIGPWMTTHTGIHKIAFTGSTVNGRSVMKGAADTLKRITLELGGNDAAIILDDADVTAITPAVASAAFTNAGQICGAIKRLFVHDAIYENLVESLAAHVRRMRVGNGAEQGVDVGPLQNDVHYRRTTALLDGASARGRVLAKSICATGPGFFVPVTLIDGLADEDPLVSSEQFAPILPILRFDDPKDAVARANASEFGLTGSVWSCDTSRARKIARELDCSLICINSHNRNPDGFGMQMAKQSGLGWLFGRQGYEDYVQHRLIL